jgi:PAS domain S-box-containing protein
VHDAAKSTRIVDARCGHQPDPGICRYPMAMSERPRTRAEIAEAFLDAYDNLVCITDFLGQYRTCNRAVTGALGWSEQELRDLSFADLAPPQERDEVMKLGADIIRRAGGAQRTYTRPMRHKDGTYRLVQWLVWADAQSRLVYGVGHVKGVVEIG